MQPEARALVVAAEGETAEALPHVGGGIGAELVGLAPELAHTGHRGVDVVDRDEHTGARAGVPAVQPAGQARRGDRRASEAPTGSNSQPNSSP